MELVNLSVLYSCTNLRLQYKELLFLIVVILASLDLLKKRYSIQKWGIDLPHLLLHCATCVQNKTRSNGQSRYITIFKSLKVLFSLVYMHILFSKSSIPTWYIKNNNAMHVTMYALSKSYTCTTI